MLHINIAIRLLNSFSELLAEIGEFKHIEFKEMFFNHLNLLSSEKV